MKCSYNYSFLLPIIQLIFLFISLCFSSSSSSAAAAAPKSSIVFTTLGRSMYQFDIYTLPITNSQSSPFISDHDHDHHELKLTDGISVNFNGHFPTINSTTSSFTPFSQLSSLPSSPAINLIYVTERNGVSNIFLDTVYHVSGSPGRPGSRSALEVSGPGRVQTPLLRVDPENGNRVSMKDRPSLVGEHLIYVSTHENTGVPRTCWAAVYSTHIPTGSTRRLTPYGVSDFSPAVSPSGVFTAVASYGENNWDGEVEELRTDIYMFSTRDGSGRVKVVEHGGWPCWVDDKTIYFHRRDDVDGWWSVYKAVLTTESVVVERVTLPGLHVFTPATSPGNSEFIVVATRRPGSDYRHIELFDVKNKEFKEVTRPISPNSHHFNPFVSPDGTRVGYHKCRGGGVDKGKDGDPILLLENIENPEHEISLFRVDGSFPSFSPKGDRIAYLGNLDTGYLYVVDYDGSNKKLVHKGMAFTTAWDPIRKGVVYTSVGPNFASERTKVDIIAINVDDDDEFTYKKLTDGGENNAFPSPSPDGKWVVFRSGRSGYKNLYIMDAEKGETGGIQRLTEGSWSDTMCNWSPDGEWIAFASDRENPGSGSFEVFMIHPNGTGLHKVIQSGSGGRANHPWFSPDGKSIVFTSDYAGVSAEPISNPHHYQPYGEIFIAKIDGSDIRRLTHNSYEDGTPTWGPKFLSPSNVVEPTTEPKCVFEDCHWLNIKKSLGIQDARDGSIGAQC